MWTRDAIVTMGVQHKFWAILSHVKTKPRVKYVHYDKAERWKGKSVSQSISSTDYNHLEKLINLQVTRLTQGFFTLPLRYEINERCIKNILD